MEVTTYLLFSGQCEEAIHFYQKALGAHIHYITYFKDAADPERIPSGWTNKVMRASLCIGTTHLIAADEPASLPPQGFALSLNERDPQIATKLFEALSEGGVVALPLQKTPWSDSFGIITDRFGINWIFNISTENSLLA